jgi:hypothetical protein
MKQNYNPFRRSKHFQQRQWQRGLDEILLQAILQDVSAMNLYGAGICIAVSRSYIKKARMGKICHFNLSPNQYLVILADNNCLITCYKVLCVHATEFQQAHPKRIVIKL